MCVPSLAHLAAAAPASLARLLVWQLGVAVVFDEEDEDESEGRELRSDGGAIVAEVCPVHPYALNCFSGLTYFASHGSTGHIR